MGNRPEIDIGGVKVSFARRDVRNVTDEEYLTLEKLVADEVRQLNDRGTVESILVETDYLDPDRFRYVASFKIRHDNSSPE